MREFFQKFKSQKNAGKTWKKMKNIFENLQVLKKQETTIRKTFLHITGEISRNF